MRVGIIGGTGPQGRGLALRFAGAGHSVLIGSRDPAQAIQSAATLAGGFPELTPPEGGSNDDVANRSDVVVIAVPWAAHEEMVRTLAPYLRGKVVVDCVNPLAFDARGPRPILLVEGSAAAQAQALLPDSRVVAAFHHLAAGMLLAGLTPLEHEDILLAGNEAAAKETVQELCQAITGHRGIDAGSLHNAGPLEAMTSVLLAVNKTYRVKSGIQLTGMPAR
jgi:NADPH-dependent F420 reductase